MFIGKVQCLQKKGQNNDALKVTSNAEGETDTLRRANTPKQRERFIIHSDLMIKMLSGNKKYIFNCTYVRIWTLRSCALLL